MVLNYVLERFQHNFGLSFLLPNRPEPHGRGGGSQPGQADSPLPEQEEEILGSDDDEQEDPNDYCKGICPSPLYTQVVADLFIYRFVCE